jgi:hypothetical protein
MFGTLFLHVTRILLEEADRNLKAELVQLAEKLDLVKDYKNSQGSNSFQSRHFYFSLAVSCWVSRFQYKRKHLDQIV